MSPVICEGGKAGYRGAYKDSVPNILPPSVPPSLSFASVPALPRFFSPFRDGHWFVLPLRPSFPSFPIPCFPGKPKTKRFANRIPGSRASDNELNSDKPKRSVGDLTPEELKGKRYGLRSITAPARLILVLARSRGQRH